MLYTVKSLREKYESDENMRACYGSFECALNDYRFRGRMKKRPVKYRLEVDYLSRSYNDRALNVSDPIYTKSEGIAEYKKAVKKYCVDDPTVPARVHLWKYNYNGNKLEPITICKNY